MRSIVLTLAFSMWVGCAGSTPAAKTPSAPEPASTSSQPSHPAVEPPVAAPAKVAATRVIVTGVLLRQGDSIEVCPGHGAMSCAGIRVEGKVEDAWLSTPDKRTVFRLSGVYDGTKLVLDAPAQATTIGAHPDFRNDCPELQDKRKGVNPDERLTATVDAFVQEHRERVAGFWWDRVHQAMSVWVKGDPTELRAQLKARAPTARICIRGQARYSELELERAREKADAILRARGVLWSSSGGDVLSNQIVYEAEAIDAGTLAELAREVGEAVRVIAFIEMTQHELAQLPVPEARGDVALVTSKMRSGMMMAALGRFQVHFDAERRCVYLGTPDARVLPVWPFGYWAVANPLRVFDFDGNEVAREGAIVEFGGGQVEIRHVRADETCGASEAWIGQPEKPRKP